jgi:ethanolamine utilization protein EutQ (cupin superfamily)
MMVKLNEILNSREKDLITEYQSAILKTDIEDRDSVFMYQNLISEMILKAKKRYYAENSKVIPIKTGEFHKEVTSKNKIKVYDLFTNEEAEEVDFLRWRMTRSIFPWTRRRNEKKIDTIIEEAKNRVGIKDL